MTSLKRSECTQNLYLTLVSSRFGDSSSKLEALLFLKVNISENVESRKAHSVHHDYHGNLIFS